MDTVYWLECPLNIISKEKRKEKNYFKLCPKLHEAYTSGLSHIINFVSVEYDSKIGRRKTWPPTESENRLFSL